MSTYALVQLSDSAVLDTRDFAGIPPDVTRKGIQWLPLVVTDSAFDPATQVRTGPVDTVGKDAVNRVWTVRAKSAGELDADKGASVDAMDAVAFKVLLNHENRLRALEGKRTATAAQFKAALKAFL